MSHYQIKEVAYKVIYFRLGYHEKIYRIFKDACVAFESIPADYSPQLKKCLI